MVTTLEQLKQKGIHVAIVGGSDLCKILEQLGGDSGRYIYFSFLISN